MLTENTITKLQQMRLSAMANAFREQQLDPNIAALSFEDRFGLLVDQEWTTRKSNHLRKLIKSAGLAEPGACVEDIEYHSDRNLDKAQIARFATCTYIAEHHNILLLGATGSGKTYLACALGMAAVRSFLTVKYIRLPELLAELAIARGSGTFRKVIQQYTSMMPCRPGNVNVQPRRRHCSVSSDEGVQLARPRVYNRGDIFTIS